MMVLHGCSTQTKVEKAQKVKGILNTFGVYDYKNDEMYTHCYSRNKTNDQFIDLYDVEISKMIPGSKQYSLY
jgi:hypothetical protein